jgi:hypothetical protein
VHTLGQNFEFLEVSSLVALVPSFGTIDYPISEDHERERERERRCRHVVGYWVAVGMAIVFAKAQYLVRILLGALHYEN